MTRAVGTNFWLPWPESGAQWPQILKFTRHFGPVRLLLRSAGMPAITIWQLGMRRCELVADADLSSVILRVTDGSDVLCNEVMDSADAALAVSERWYVAHEQHVFGFSQR